MVSIGSIQLTKIWNKAGKHHAITLTVGTKQRLTIIKDVDFDPVKGNLKHVAFHAIKMNEKMRTGDFDCDFADIMTIHHQEALDLCEVEILRGNDTELKWIAQNMLDLPKNDNTELGQFVENYRIVDPEKQKYDLHYELTETMKMMLSKMNRVKMTGNSDNDFVALMIPHHQSGLEMAKDEISHGKNSKIKKIAQNIVEVQSKELSALKSWKSNISYFQAK